MQIRIIAEVAQGFAGSKEVVDLYVRGVSETEADAVKFQIFLADELALPDYKYYELYKSLQLPFDVWRRAVQDAHRTGLGFYSDIFGVKSLRKLQEIGVDGFKIHPTDINNMRLLKHIARTRKKVLLATGGSELAEIGRALDVLSSCDVTLMHGFQADPTEAEDNNLRRIKTLREKFKKPVGFMDHTAGDSELSYFVPFIAMGQGASLIEKHVTLTRLAEVEHSISALTIAEFLKWSRLVKQASPSLGQAHWKLTKKEVEYRRKVRRALCAASDLRAGKTIRMKDVEMKRTSDKNAIFELDLVIGNRLKKNVKKNSLITRRALS